MNVIKNSSDFPSKIPDEDISVRRAKRILSGDYAVLGGLSTYEKREVIRIAIGLQSSNGLVHVNQVEAALQQYETTGGLTLEVEPVVSEPATKKQNKKGWKIIKPAPTKINNTPIGIILVSPAHKV